jgi:ATP-dependent Clp protease ATP-binding subunit ClpC
VFERFTELARQVVVFAQEEARSLDHNYIGTEHLLLGLLREEEGLGARVLVSLGVSLDAVRGQVARIIGLGDEVGSGQIPFTPRAKKVLELSLRQALGLGHGYIGTEHLLLGLVAEGEGVACRILLDFGVTAEAVREAVARALGGAQVELHGPRRVPFPALPRRVPSLAGPRFGGSTALAVGWVLFAVSLGIGIVIGWAIWG